MTDYIRGGALQGVVIVDEEGVPVASGSDASAANQEVANAHLQNLVDATPEDGTFSGTASSAISLATFDCRGYGYIAFQFTTVGTGTITVESSSDGTPGTGSTFGAQVAYIQNSVTAGAMQTIVNPTAGVLYVVPVTGHTMRLRISTWTSGTYVVAGVKKIGPAPVGPTTYISAIGNGPPIQGTAAHDAAVAGAPNRIAGRAQTANYTAVASGDTADILTTTVGALVVRPHAIPEACWSYAAASGGIVNTTTAVTIKAAGAAGLKNYLTGLDIASDTLGSATEVAVRDGAGGTVLWRQKLDTTATKPTRLSFDPPLAGTAATLLEVVTLTATVTGGVYVNARGYTAP